MKLSKCSFAQQEIEYLGHTISGSGVSTEAAKVQVVEQWPVPKNLRELRGFLGLTGYYRRFIKHYGLISKPISDLLKKGSICVDISNSGSLLAAKNGISASPSSGLT